MVIAERKKSIRNIETKNWRGKGMLHYRKKTNQLGDWKIYKKIIVKNNYKSDFPKSNIIQYKLC